MNIKKRMSLCKNLTPVEIQIATYILENMEVTSRMTIQQLSDIIPVSKSAIHRLCKKLGFKGFNDMKVQLGKDTCDIYRDNTFIDVNYPFEKDDDVKHIAYKMTELYNLTIKETFDFIVYQDIQHIADLIKQSSAVDIYANSHNLTIAENFQEKMLTIRKIVNVPKTKGQQELTVLASDHTHLAIILSYSGKARFIGHIINQLYEKDITVVLISQIGKNAYPEYIQYSIGLCDKENMRERISQFSSYIAMQYIMDVIYASYFNENRQQNMRYILNNTNYADDRHLD